MQIYNKIHTTKNKDSKIIIDYVFQAEKSAKDFDRLNTQSSALFKKAINISEQNNYKDFEIWTNLNYGYYLYTLRKYEDCYPYFLFCIEKLKDINADQIINPIDTYKRIAFFLITDNENDLAISFLKKAEKISDLQTVNMATIKDNIGLAYLNKNDLLKATKYFKQALAISRNIKNQTREAKALGNLAEVDFRNKNYPAAIRKLRQDIVLSEKNDNDQNTMFALIKLCKVYLENDQTFEAENAINLAQKYASLKPYYKNSQYEINEFLVKIAQKEANATKELSARRNMDVLADSLKTMDGKVVINSLNWRIGKKILEYNIALEKSKYEKQFYLKIIAYLVSGGLIIAMIILVLMSRKKIKTRQMIYEKNLLSLQMEKLISENKLNSKTKSLLSYRNYLLEKIDQIQELETELNKTQNISKNKKNDYTLKLDHLLKSHLLTTENWINFKEAFEKEKPEYKDYLERNFPELTEANFRVIYLSQLELSNPEIARVLGVTLAAVKKAKQRLRIKYKDHYDKFFEINA